MNILIDCNSILPFVATSSSVYYNDSTNWGPAFAIDNAQSNTWHGFFHSAKEPLPWLKIKLPGAPNSETIIRSVTLRSRCDTNFWSCSNTTNTYVEVKI